MPVVVLSKIGNLGALADYIQRDKDGENRVLSVRSHLCGVLTAADDMERTRRPYRGLRTRSRQPLRA